MQSRFFLFRIDWELRGVRTFWVMVANLAFLKPDCENLAFLTCLAFFQRPERAGQIWLFLEFFLKFGFISNTKKIRQNLFYSGYFSEHLCTNLLVKAIRPTNCLCDVTVTLCNSGSLLFWSRRFHVLKWLHFVMSCPGHKALMSALVPSQVFYSRSVIFMPF